MAADFLVRHHGDGRELIGHDGQHALLGRGGDGRRLRLRRALAVAAGRGAGDARRRSRRNDGFRRTIGLGAVTVISGSCVEAGGAAASWAIAPSPIAHSNSQLAPPKWNARFFLNVIVPILIPSMCDGSISIFPRWIGRVCAAIPLGSASINRGQEAGGARDWNAGCERAEMRELGVGGQVQKFDRLRQLQQRRRGEQEIVGQRDDGADRAGSAGCWSVSWSEGCCCCAASLAAARAAAMARSRSASAGLNRRRGAATSPWKCPNDSANWIASANSASREPCLRCFRNQFMTITPCPDAKASRPSNVIL